MTIVDVTAFGADRSGRTDSFFAVEQAARSLQPGDVLWFPPGTYWTAPRSAMQREHFITIGTSDVTVEGPATLLNFMFNVAGTFGARVSFRLERGDRREARLLAEPGSGLAAGAWLQLLSATNAYSEQAGDDQGGSVSPSSDVLYAVRFAEFVSVDRVEGDAIIAASSPRFDQYGQADEVGPDAELAAQAPELRAATFVERVRFSALRFDMTEHRYFRTLRFRTARGCSVSDCEFIAGELPGRHITAGDTLDLTVSHNRSRRRPAPEARGSSWNSFVFGAGCQRVEFVGNTVLGDWQAVDFTSYGDPDFDETEAEGSSWRSAQEIRIHNNNLTDCHDGITTHPGVFDVEITGNTVRASSNGARVRSRRNVILGNVLETERSGITFSSFFNDTVVVSNRISRDRTSAAGAEWTGMTFLLTSQEVMTDNAVSNVLVATNTMGDARALPTSTGIRVYHDRAISAAARGRFERFRENSCNVLLVDNMTGGLPVNVDEDCRGFRFGGAHESGSRTNGREDLLALADVPEQPGHVIRVNHRGDGSGRSDRQTFGLDIANWPGARQAMTIHQYSGVREALRLDNTDGNAAIYLNNTQNLNRNPGRSGKGAPFLKFHPYDMKDFSRFAYLLDDLTFANSTNRTWGFASEGGNIVEFRSATGEVLSAIDATGRLVGGPRIAPLALRLEHPELVGAIEVLRHDNDVQLLVDAVTFKRRTGTGGLPIALPLGWRPMLDVLVDARLRTMRGWVSAPVRIGSDGRIAWESTVRAVTSMILSAGFKTSDPEAASDER